MMQILRSVYSISLLLLAVKASGQQARVTLPLPAGHGAAAGNKSAAVTQSSPISMLEVVDLSGDSLVLGYIPAASGGNERTAIVTPVPKQEWLQASMGEAGSKVFASRGTSGLLVVNDISVGKHAGGNYARIKCAVYETPIGTQQYKRVAVVDEFITDASADVATIAHTLAGALQGSAAVRNAAALAGEPQRTMTKEAVIEEERAKVAFISKSMFSSGIYLSFDEFKHQKPAHDRFHIRTDAASGNVEVQSFSVTDSTLRPVQNAWGIAVANELYVIRNGKLLPAEAVGGNLVLSKYIDPDTRKNNAAFWRMNIGSQMQEHDAGNPFSNRYVIELDNYRNRGVKGEAKKLNAETGEPEL